MAEWAASKSWSLQPWIKPAARSLDRQALIASLMMNAFIIMDIARPKPAADSAGFRDVRKEH